MARTRSRGWSFPLARIAGVELRVHATFFIIVLLFAMASVGPDGAGLPSGMAWLAIVFACVVVHEMAHSVVARRRGIGVESITLLPIGGVSKLETMPENPDDEFTISIVGPLASLALAVAAFGVAGALGVRILPFDIYGGAIVTRVAWFNVVLAGFNLLPAFPMDGGRVLRAWLDMRMDRVRATRYAAVVGRIFAAAMIVGGFVWNLWLGIIGVFVLLGASAEESTVRLRSRIKSLTVRDVMMYDPLTVDLSDRLEDLRPMLRRTMQRAFPVLDHGRYAGMLDAAVVETGPGDMAAGDRVDRAAPTASPADGLLEHVEELQESRLSAIAVVESGVVVGLLRMDDVARRLARRDAPAA